MNTIYFVRHAQSDHNIPDDLIRPLTEKGIKDRKLVTSFLEDKNIDLVFSSPCKRSIDTISDFSEKFGFEVKLIDNFKERKVDSIWVEDFKSFFEKQWADFSYKLSDGECLAEVQSRNVEALNHILKQYNDKNIVIGTHGTALSTIINYYDNSYNFNDFMGMVDIMPWVVKIEFDENKCLNIEKINVLDIDFFTQPLNPNINLKRIEFIVTNFCTSKCKHCSRGDFLDTDKINIDKDKAVSIIEELSKFYKIESVMTFGGEPLLYSDTVCEIHKTGTKCGISSRQIITNGYFSKDKNKICSIAKELKVCGVNSILLSVDVFHSEHISLETVKIFAEALFNEKIPGFKLHPAWVVNRNHENDYNKQTENCLNYFSDLDIPISSGNNIFLSGNATKYLLEFYEKKPINLHVKCGEAPYTSKLDNIESISINPNGDVTVCCFVIGNIYKDSIINIIKSYNPNENEYMSALINGGVSELLSIAKNQGISIDTTQFYSSCEVCREINKKL